MLKNKVFRLILFVIAFFVFWNLCDYLFTTFITHNVFTFTVFGDAILPTVIAITTGLFIVWHTNV